MRHPVRTLALSLSIAATPTIARAQRCSSAPECLIRAGLTGGRLDPKLAALLGAGAAAVLAGGAAATASRAVERPLPAGVVVEPATEGGKPRLRLTLLPPAKDRYAPGLRVERAAPSGAFRFNDTATNVALAVGGVGVLAGIIYGIVKK